MYMEFYKMHQYRIILQYIKNESFNSNSALRSSNKKKKDKRRKICSILESRLLGRNGILRMYIPVNGSLLHVIGFFNRVSMLVSLYYQRNASKHSALSL